MSNVAGIVLCGGRSSRMGRPKEWLPFGAEFMLPRVVRLLSEIVSPIVVVAAPKQDLPPLPPDAITARDPAEGLGPLQGLIAGLTALPKGIDAAYVSSCDVPLLRPAFVRRMIDLLGDLEACVPQVDGYMHPLAAVYRTCVVVRADQLLQSGHARLSDLCLSIHTRFVAAADLHDVDPSLESLRNVNTPEEYVATLRELPK